MPLYSEQIVGFLAKPITQYFAEGATPAASEYAEKTVSGAIEHIPGTLRGLAQAYVAYSTGKLVSLPFVLKTGLDMTKNKKAVQDTLLVPLAAYHHYRNYTFLNGVKEDNSQSKAIQILEDTEFQALASQAIQEKTKLSLDLDAEFEALAATAEELQEDQEQEHEPEIVTALAKRLQ